MRATDLASGTLRDPQEDYSSFNPRVGLLYALSPSSEAFASVGRLYKAPTTFELEDDVRGDSRVLDAMRGASGWSVVLRSGDALTERLFPIEAGAPADQAAAIAENLAASEQKLPAEPKERMARFKNVIRMHGH